MRRADHSFRTALPSVCISNCVHSINFTNEAAKARLGLLRHRKPKIRRHWRRTLILLFRRDVMGWSVAK